MPTTQAQPSVGPTIQPEARELPTPAATVGGVAATTRAEPPLDTAADGDWRRPQHPDGRADAHGSRPPARPRRRTTRLAGLVAAQPDRSASEAPSDAALAEPADGSPAPPRESYARLDAPDAVVAEIPFELVVGLSKEPDPEVAAAKLIVPESVHGEYDLTIQLLADGFERVDGGDDPWLVRLPVNRRGLRTRRSSLTLRPVPTDRPVRARQVKALYAVGGQAMGEASRSIIVVDTEERLAALGPSKRRRSRRCPHRVETMRPT